MFKCTPLAFRKQPLVGLYKCLVLMQAISPVHHYSDYNKKKTICFSSFGTWSYACFGAQGTIATLDADSLFAINALSCFFSEPSTAPEGGEHGLGADGEVQDGESEPVSASPAEPSEEAPSRPTPREVRPSSVQGGSLDQCVSGAWEGRALRS